MWQGRSANSSFTTTGFVKCKFEQEGSKQKCWSQTAHKESYEPEKTESCREDHIRSYLVSQPRERVAYETVTDPKNDRLGDCGCHSDFYRSKYHNWHNPIPQICCFTEIKIEDKPVNERESRWSP